MKKSYVYIMASRSGVLYIGVTSDLEKRVYQHKHELLEGFSKKYKTHRLVYYEEGEDMIESIEREKQLKGLKREKKIKLIEENNPAWEDLSQQWY